MVMKKLALILCLLWGLIASAQKDTLPFKIDTSLTNLKTKTYVYENYSNPAHLEYYNKRIVDVLKKIEYVVTHEYQFAIDRGWFQDAKGYLKAAVQAREEFLLKK